MTPNELAQENHAHFIVTLPQRMFDEAFESTIWKAHGEAVGVKLFCYGDPDVEFCQYGWEDGYIGITAAAAEFWVNNRLDAFDVASRFCTAISGELNDRAVVEFDTGTLVFTIEDYETEGPERGFVRVTQPLDLPHGTRLDRRVMIRLKPPT